MPRTAQRRQRYRSDSGTHEQSNRVTAEQQQTQDGGMTGTSEAMSAQRKLAGLVSGSARQSVQQRRAESIHASRRQAMQRKTMPSTMPVIQREAVVQRREVAAIKVDIDALKGAVNAFGNLPTCATAASILAREAALLPHRASRALLHAEIQEKAVAHGRPVGTEVAINARLAQIPGELATATADVAAGSQPAPPKPVAVWGAAPAAYRIWEAKNSKLAENQQKIIDLNAETASKTADIPIAQLIDARDAVDTKLAALDANLLKVKRERYEMDLITTQAPACTTFKDEDSWGFGPSILGVFVFPLPAVLNGIACCIDRVEVHAHYQGGTRRIRKAHFRSGPSNGDNIYNGEPAAPAEIGGWQGAVMGLCNASIP